MVPADTELFVTGRNHRLICAYLQNIGTKVE